MRLSTSKIDCGLPNDPPNPMGDNCSWCFLGRGHLVLQEKPRAAHRTSSISTRWLKKKNLIFVNFEACNNALYITTYCQWFYADRDAVVIHHAIMTPLKCNLPNAHEILVTQYDLFRTGWVTFGEYFRVKGHHPPTTVNVRKLERLPFRVVSKYPQFII